MFSVWLVSLVIYSMLIEYFGHRFFMHRRTNCMFEEIFLEHAVEHHTKERYDINVDMPFLTVILSALPVILFSFFLGWIYLFFSLLFCYLYSVIWTKIHRSTHGLKGGWKIPFIYKYLEKHHLNHHKNPRKNFGTIFGPTLDYIFGTKYNDSSK